jgi:general secretion pathway protein K
MVVLWYLVLIAAVATYLMAHGRSEIAIARNIKAAAIAEALSDAAVAEAAFNLSARPTSERWELNGEPHVMSRPDGEATIRVYDESQKINPNLASDALIAALFQTVGVERARAIRLGSSMADWVDAGSEPRRFGAELPEYVAAGRSYGPANAAIENLDDLMLVLGMTPEALALVRPYLTIHTDSAQPEAQGAPSTVRRALALAARAAVDGGGQSDGPAPEEATARTSSASLSAGPQKIVRFEIVARISGGGVFVREAVLKLPADHPKGYVVLDWQRGDSLND